MKKLTIFLDKKDEECIDFVLNFIAIKIKKGFNSGTKIPVDWKMTQTDEKHNSVFILFEKFEIDNKTNRLFLGAFDNTTTMKKAILDTFQTKRDNLEIVETTLNDIKI